MALAWIDALYDEFCDAIPGGLRSRAEELAFTLGLAPKGVPWSQVFNHEITLAAPWVLSEAMPNIDPYLVRRATLAHMLGIMEAFATDRVEDGQVEETEDLKALLFQVRRARDGAFEDVCKRACGVELVDYAHAEDCTHQAILAERRWLQGRGRLHPASHCSVVIEPGSKKWRSLGLLRYEVVSSGKQAVGMPACLALAGAAGWSQRALGVTERMLLSVWLGLQEHDDVVDWQEDVLRGGAWAVVLSRLGDGDAAPKDLVGMRDQVHRSGVLASLLNRASWQFRGARRRASVLGIERLEGWCRSRERELDRLAHLEQSHPGYVFRERVLRAQAFTESVVERVCRSQPDLPTNERGYP